VTPFWKQAETDGFARWIPGTGTDNATYIMQKDFYIKQPDVAKAMLRALVRTHRTYLQGDYHPDAKVMDVIAKAMNIPAATIIAPGLQLRFTSDLKFTPKVDQLTLDDQAVWIATGGCTYSTPLPLDRINDTMVLDAVLAER
jgi:NitT/TauT family transport system substrate-binding protein